MTNTEAEIAGEFLNLFVEKFGIIGRKEEGNFCFSFHYGNKNKESGICMGNELPGNRYKITMDSMGQVFKFITDNYEKNENDSYVKKDGLF
jgi:hypothetical protein